MKKIYNTLLAGVFGLVVVVLSTNQAMAQVTDDFPTVDVEPDLVPQDPPPQPPRFKIPAYGRDVMGVQGLCTIECVYGNKPGDYSGTTQQASDACKRDAATYCRMYEECLIVVIRASGRDYPDVPPWYVSFSCR
ncbi:MAG: hypothetical protein ACK502_02270 [Alphaproteobacteria bacterium]